MADRLLTTAEAAKAIGVSARSLSRWASERKLRPALRTPGGQARWDLAELKKQLQAWDDDEDQAEDDR